MIYRFHLHSLYRKYRNSKNSRIYRNLEELRGDLASLKFCKFNFICVCVFFFTGKKYFEAEDKLVLEVIRKNGERG